MKRMNQLISMVLFVWANQQLSAAPLSVQAQILGANGKLDSSRSEYAGSTAGLSRTGRRSIDEAVTAPGVGVSMDYKFGDATHLGATARWVNYDEGNTKPQYTDTAAGLNASYDVLKMDQFAVYGMGGFSYHWLDSVDRRIGDETVSLDNADLVNYDLGVGTRIALASAVQLDLSYRFSDSLQKDDVPTQVRGRLVEVKGEYKDLALRTNELVAAVGYAF